jgi:SAM-dependent methyltransferase
MSTNELGVARDAIIARHGEWTAHNIHLGGDLYTLDQSHPKFRQQLAAHGVHLRRILQIVSDHAARPLRSLRVLDLGCLEGLYAIEFARHGAEVVGIEGREAGVVKSRFAKDALGLDRLTFLQGDVRDLSAARHGRFDVVLCLGVLYHLDAPAVFHFVERMAEVCTRLCIIDTHVGLRPNIAHDHRGRTYHGFAFREFAETATEADKARAAWSALDNVRSFWLTRPSLYNLLARSGFPSVSTCQVPAVPGAWLDRDTIVALRGDEVSLRSMPGLDNDGRAEWSETTDAAVYPAQASGTGRSRARQILARLLRR